MTEKYIKVREILEKYNQLQVLDFYEELSESQKEKLLDKILSFDLEQLKNIYEALKHDKHLEYEIEPTKFEDKSKISDEDKSKYEKIGEKVISEGKFAVITMAGGQGTRLGHNGPKGTFYLGLKNDKSLFEIMFENINEMAKKLNAIIPWYIMTSNENHEDTISFFEKQNYFGYDKDAIKFFPQGELPMLDSMGKILLQDKGIIKEGPDGHGGIFYAMRKNNIIEDLEKRKIEWVFIAGIDNVLMKMTDTIQIGMTIDKGFLASSKTVAKREPSERTGVFCLKNGRPSIIEYTEITEEMANMRDENGELCYGESNIIGHLLNFSELKRITDVKLPYHGAFKKASYIDKAGELIEPVSPNSYKFESFIFDAFERLDKMLILRTKREDEFAPIKNGEGVDSPETARHLYKKYFKIEG